MSHTSAIVKVEPLGDGLLAVTVRCCNDKTTDSVLTLHELHREDSAIDADIQAHQARIEKLHAARDHAKAHIERLLKR
jgi:peptidoglycan hydrolase CwlO-like protein